jgi:hypothetical protein
MDACDQKTASGKPGFFAVHIDCRGEQLRWQVEQMMAGS